MPYKSLQKTRGHSSGYGRQQGSKWKSKEEYVAWKHSPPMIKIELLPPLPQSLTATHTCGREMKPSKTTGFWCPPCWYAKKKLKICAPKNFKEMKQGIKKAKEFYHKIKTDESYWMKNLG